MELKRYLARTLVRMYHNREAAKEAESHFDVIHKKKDIPDDIPEYKLTQNLVKLIDLMVDAGLVSGKSEARRIIRQGGVKLNGEIVNNELLELQIESEAVLKVGKRKFLKLRT